MNESEDYTPSLVAGLIRYKTRVLATLAAFALLGALYAFVSWRPEATMSVAVQVASGVTGQSNVDPDRATSEVAAQLASPQVVAAAENAAGVTLGKVSANSSQGNSTIAVVVAAGSDQDAEAGANALIPAYQQIRVAQNSEQIAAQLAVIDASIADVDNSISLVTSQLGTVPATSAQAASLQGELDTLTARRNQLRSDRDQAQIAASSNPLNVSVADGPNPGPGRLSLLMRYVPAGIVLGLLICMGVIAVVERRRPWLSDVDSAGRLLRGPVIAVGARASAAVDPMADDVAPVVAMSMMRAVGDNDPGVALLLPRGSASLGDASLALAHRMQAGLERAGTSVNVISITSTGRAFVMEDGQMTSEVTGLWNELGSREQFEKALERSGVVADLTLVVPVVDVEQEVLLDLVLVSDACVVVTTTGIDLAPLLALRRDFDALGRRPDGVVVDPPIPTPVA